MDYLYNYIGLTHKKMISGVELVIDQVNMFAVRLLVNQEVYAIVNNKGYDHNQKEYRLRKVMEEALAYKDIIGGITIVTNDGEYYQFTVDGSELHRPDPSYIQQIQEMPTPVWGPIMGDINGSAYILLGRKYRNFYTGQHLGSLVLHIRENAVFDTYQNIIDDVGYSFCMTEDGCIVSHAEKNKIGTYLFDPELFRSEKSFEYKTVIYGGKPVVMAISNFNNRLRGLGLNWKIVSVISEKSLFSIMDKINLYIGIMAFGMGVVIIFLSIYIPSMVTRSILRLRDGIREFANGKTEVVISNRFHDEIWELEESFNEMTVKIKELIQRNNLEKEKQREMELTALQAQINPHFIYNTLDAIGWMAKLRKQHDIEQMVMALGTFFRTSLHKGDKFITVKEEIELIQSYVTVELMRFPERFEIEYDIEDYIQDHLILKIILQPLVENAIKHGISEKEEKGHIYISGRKIDQDIVFEVVDDGVGFDADDDRVLLKKEDSFHSGYGIRNVNERIQLEYGKEYGLKIYSRKNQGTRVQVRIPW